MKKTRIYYLLLFILIISLLTGCVLEIESGTNQQITNTSGDLAVHYLDVGQADSILLINSDKVMLIDCGDTDAKNVIIPYLNKLGIKKIDYLVLTHAHKDHIGSAVDVIKSFDIGKIYISPKETTTKTFENLLDIIDEKKIDTVIPNPGEKFTFGSCNAEFIGPVADYNDLNNSSLVMTLQNGSNTFLFTGDMEKDSEYDIIKAGYNKRIDVLKVAHHGSSGSSVKEFLNILKPSISIISCGTGNDYGHPHKELLERLNAIKTKIYRTDKAGTIIIKSDGTNIYVNDEKTSDLNQSNNTGQSQNTVFIGNKNSKVFHTEDCNSLPAEDNRIYFNSRDEAISSGYKPCSRCNP